GAWSPSAGCWGRSAPACCCRSPCSPTPRPRCCACCRGRRWCRFPPRCSWAAPTPRAACSTRRCGPRRCWRWPRCWGRGPGAGWWSRVVDRVLVPYALLVWAWYRAAAQYPVSLMLLTLALLGAIGSELVALLFVFGHTEALGGFTLAEALLVYGL